MDTGFHILVLYTALAVLVATEEAKKTIEAAVAATAEAAWIYGAAIDKLWLYCFSPHIPLRPYGTHTLYTTTDFYGVDSGIRGGSSL